jgi:hypothetical protein
MRHDPFEFDAREMTLYDRAWRIAFLAAALVVLILDVFVWRP